MIRKDILAEASNCGRMKTGKAKDDNYVDACGYMAIAAEIALLNKYDDALEKIKEIPFHKPEPPFKE